MNLEPIDTSTDEGKLEVMTLAVKHGRRVCVRSLQAGSLAGRHTPWAEDPAPKWDWKWSCYGIIAMQVGPDEVWLTFNEAGKLFATSDHCPEWKQPGIAHARYVRAEE